MSIDVNMATRGCHTEECNEVRRLNAERARIYRANNRDKVRKYQNDLYHRTKHQYPPQGAAKLVSTDTYFSMVDAQGNRCKLCGSPPNGRGRLHLDHNHDTGVVRGLLCHHCNVALGHLQDNPMLMERAAEYVRNDGDI